ncbi:MAG: DoxX family protein [Sulfurovaceae bacterium]|nr:DoxX family protein [Sulfurovaceae bacterium]
MKSDYGKLVLRFMVGGMMLLHGLDKLAHGIDFIKSTLVSHNLPVILAYGVYVGEVLAPLFLIAGYKSRLAAVAIVFDMLMAIYLVHMKDIFSLSSVGAWAIETEMFYLLGSLSIILLGSGKYAVKPD